MFKAFTSKKNEQVENNSSKNIYSQESDTNENSFQGVLETDCKNMAQNFIRVSI